METTKKEDLLQTLEKKAEFLRKRIEHVNNFPLDKLLEAFPLARFVASDIGSELDIRLPYDFAMIAKMRNFLKELGYERVYEHSWITEADRSASYHLVAYLSADVLPSLDIWFDSDREGATCVINKIGKQRKTVYTYEVICAAGAEEKAL